MEGDSKPKRTRVWYFTTALLLITVAFLMMPFVLCRTNLAERIVCGILSLNEDEIHIDSLRIGWWTPLSISGLELGKSSEPNWLTVDQVHSNLTFGQLVLGTNGGWGTWTLHGMKVHSVVRESRLGIEQVVLASVETNESSDNQFGRIVVQDFQAWIHDSQSHWTVKSSEFDLSLSGQDWKVKTGLRLRSPEGRESIFKIDGQHDSGVGTSLMVEANRMELAPLVLIGERFGLDSSIDALLNQISTNSKTGSSPSSENRSRPKGQISGRLDAKFAAAGVNEIQFKRCILESFSYTPPSIPDTSFRNHRASINGRIMWIDSAIQLAVNAETDFASFECNLSIPQSSSSETQAWAILDELLHADGEAHILLDYKILSQCVPNDWVRPHRISSDLTAPALGKLDVRLQTVKSNGETRNVFGINSGPLSINLWDQQIQIPQAHFSMTARLNSEHWYFEKINFDSAALSLQAEGSARGGSANWVLRGEEATKTFPDLDFAGIQELSGNVHGETKWQLDQLPKVRIDSSVSTETLRANGPSGQEAVLVPMKSDVKIRLQMASEGLPQLLTATIDSAGGGIKLNATLNSSPKRSTSDPSWAIRADGELYPIVNAARPWLPAEIVNADGHGTLTLSGDHLQGSFVVRRGSVRSQNPRIAWGRRLVKTQSFSAEFDGAYVIGKGELSVKRFTAESDSLKASLSGHALANDVQANLQWEYDLQRESRFKSYSANVLIDRSETSSIGRVIAGARHRRIDRAIEGRFSGTIRVTGDHRILDIQSNSRVQELAVVERMPVREIDQNASVLLAGSKQSIQTSTASDETTAGRRPGLSLWRVLWSEPEVSLTVKANSTRGTGAFLVNDAQLSATSFAAHSSGSYQSSRNSQELRLDGELDIRFPQLGKQLAHLAGIPIHLHGNRRSPFTVRLSKKRSNPMTFLAETILKWDSGEMAGVSMGAAEIPVALSQEDLRILGGTIPVGDGKLNLDGVMEYHSAPTVLNIHPGMIAESIQLTPEITERWIRFIAPPVQRVSDIKGDFGIEIDEARVVLSNPKDSRILGRLLIDRGSMSLTPMVRDLIRSAKRYYADSVTTKLDDPQGLVTVPKQEIEFYLDLGIVHHNQAVIEVDGVRVSSAGDVTTDGKLAIVAELPIDQLLGRESSPTDSQKMLTVPVTGSIYQPVVDPTGIGSIVTLVGRVLPRSQKQESTLSIDAARSSLNRTKSLLETISRAFGDSTPSPKKR